VGKLALSIDYGAVDQRHVPSRLPSVAAVDVAEDMQPRLDPEKSAEQILASMMPCPGCHSCPEFRTEPHG